MIMIQCSFFLSSCEDSIKYCSWHMVGTGYASSLLFSLPLHSSSKPPHNTNFGICPIGDVQTFADTNCKGVLNSKCFSLVKDVLPLPSSRDAVKMVFTKLFQPCPQHITNCWLQRALMRGRWEDKVLWIWVLQFPLALKLCHSSRCPHGSLITY